VLTGLGFPLLAHQGATRAVQHHPTPLSPFRWRVGPFCQSCASLCYTVLWAPLARTTHLTTTARTESVAGDGGLPQRPRPGRCADSRPTRNHRSIKHGHRPPYPCVRSSPLRKEIAATITAMSGREGGFTGISVPHGASWSGSFASTR
jgi:hypothetical protein